MVSESPSKMAQTREGRTFWPSVQPILAQRTRWQCRTHSIGHRIRVTTQSLHPPWIQPAQTTVRRSQPGRLPLSAHSRRIRSATCISASISQVIHHAINPPLFTSFTYIYTLLAHTHQHHATIKNNCAIVCIYN